MTDHDFADSIEHIAADTLNEVVHAIHEYGDALDGGKERRGAALRFLGKLSTAIEASKQRAGTIGC